MALRAMVTDLESVDEALRPLYAEKSGKYVLDVEAADGFDLQDVTALTRALGVERHTNAQYKTKLNAYGDLDPVVARDALTKITEFGDIDPARAREAMETAERLSKLDPTKEAEKIADDKFNRAKSQLQGQFKLREDELGLEINRFKETLDRRERQVERLLKENAVKTELGKAKPLSDASDLLERMISDSVRLREVNGQYVAEVVDADGTPRIKDHTGTPFTVADLVAEVREKKASMFQPDQTRGVGLTPPANTGNKTVDRENPWVKGPGFSLTKQMILMNTDPKKAQSMMAEAGADF